MIGSNDINGGTPHRHLTVDANGRTLTNPLMTTTNTKLDTINTTLNGGLPTALTASGNLKVSIEESSAGGDASAANQSTMITHLSEIEGAVETLEACVSGSELQVDIVGGNITGFATETTLANAETHLGTIEGDTTSIDGKITQGYDIQVASGGDGLQQILTYGRDSSGNLDALRTDASGHLEVVVDDFVKGQDTMTNSFPVVIASDQSAIQVSSDKTTTQLLYGTGNLVANGTPESSTNSVELKNNTSE